MKVFISGPMSGKPNYNREAFFKAQEELESHGYSVWNPAWLAYPDTTEFSKDDMHAIDNEALRHCDTIYMLKGWQDSDGAWNEHSIAVIKGLMIMYEGPCCWGKESEKSKFNSLEKQYKDLADDMEDQDILINCHHNCLMNHTERIEVIEKDIKNQEDINTSVRDNLSHLNANWYELQQTCKDITDLVNSVCDIRLDFNTRLRAMNERIDIISNRLDDNKEAHMHLNNADGALDRRIEFLERKCKGIGSIVEKHCDNNKTINNSLTDLNIRLKAIEKRLGI